jgi:hypothetical protein
LRAPCWGASGEAGIRGREHALRLADGHSLSPVDLVQPLFAAMEREIRRPRAFRKTLSIKARFRSRRTIEG